MVGKGEIEASTQYVFLKVVLQHGVSKAVQEQATDQLTPLLQFRCYSSIADAVAEQGQPAVG